MSLTLIILIAIFILLSIGIFLFKGWNDGIITLLFIVGSLFMYFLFLKLWRAEGKKYLAIASLFVASLVFYFRKRRGKNLWF